MADELLGPVFEIHGGGLDLVFPHHENELAQSRALGYEFAKLWMHNGLLQFTDEKMSKSLGNVVTIRDALERYGREALLLFFMTGHWRKPLDFSEGTMASAQTQWLRFQAAFRVPRAEPPPGEWERLVARLDDDFNTPEALALLHEWRARGYWVLLDRGLRIFGLELPPMAGTNIEVERLREDRDRARERRDWEEADRLRVEIDRRGFVVQDEPGGSRLVQKS